MIFVKKQPFFSVKYFFKNDEQPKKTVGEMCVYGEAYINKRGQIKFKKMYWISRTKVLLIFKCTGNPEYEMCLYGEGILRIKEC